MKKFLLIMAMLCTILRAQTMSEQPTKESELKNRFEVSPFFAYFKIYSFQCSFALDDKNHLVLGMGYQNEKYDFGWTHAPSLIIGYKRTIWKDLSAEYVLWPAYNSFSENNENKTYEGFELWHEIRVSYEYSFSFAGIEMIALPQLVVGKGLVSGNKPQSFTDYYKKEESIFIRPNISFGFKF